MSESKVSDMLRLLTADVFTSLSDSLETAENSPNHAQAVTAMSKVFAFGPFELDLAAAELRRDGAAVHVPATCSGTTAPSRVRE